TIDDLWIKYSNGRFGFSVQNQIYQGLGGTRKYNDEIWAAFGDKVGWRQGERRLWYEDVTFNIFAPQGHLPARFWDDWDGKGVGGGSRSIGRVTSLLLRLVNCNI
ncbi:GUN4 domain-containing protein, partial [Dolichospermum planctonicum CS-1226]